MEFDSPTARHILFVVEDDNKLDPQILEKRIIDKGLTAPRVSIDDINNAIVGEYYFTAFDGAMHRGESAIIHPGLNETQAIESLQLLTFCVLVLANGFTVTGESACASPDNFDPDVGKSIARHKAVDKIWPLLGYKLKCDLAEKL